MTHRRTGISSWAHARRFAAAVTMGLLVTACGGGSAELTRDELVSSATPVAGDPALPEGAGVEAVAGQPSVEAASDASSWTKPAGFDAALADAIVEQPEFMGGYGGQVDNPFPQPRGTSRFSGIQVTRPDAITFGEFFGRQAFRFYVDAASRHSNGLRAEFTGGGDFRFEEGDTYNYEFETYFADDYKNESWTEWNLFAQFHGPGFPAWGLHTAGGYLHMKPPSASENEFRVEMPARGEWHHFSWTIHWSKGSKGWATLEIDGEPVFDYRGATMHPSEDFYYPKFGAYLANNPYTQVTYSTPWTITAR
jgi:hypothetical protein